LAADELSSHELDYATECGIYFALRFGRTFPHKSAHFIRMKYLFALLLGSLVSSSSLFAQDLVDSKSAKPNQQTAPPQSEADKVYTSVEQMPIMADGGVGNRAIVAAIQREAKYPPLALRNQAQGRVFVTFIVNTLGDVTNIKVVKGLGSGLDEETVRAVGALPRFSPGKQGGRPVNVSYTVPITWAIQ
jgi:TonB family protein